MREGERGHLARLSGILPDSSTTADNHNASNQSARVSHRGRRQHAGDSGQNARAPLLNLQRERAHHARAEIPLRSFAVFLQVALRREKVRLCQRQ